jgi:hypothetical protein
MNASIQRANQLSRQLLTVTAEVEAAAAAGEAEAGDGDRIDQGPAQLSEALICCTVVPMRPLTVATDSALSLDDGRLLTRIWKATVTTQPGGDASGAAALLDAPASPEPGRPSGRMAKPDGSSGMPDGSSPLITTFAAGRSIGEYTTSDPDASVELSCKISMLFWFAFSPCETTKIKRHQYVIDRIDQFISSTIARL